MPPTQVTGSTIDKVTGTLGSLFQIVVRDR